MDADGAGSADPAGSSSLPRPRGGRAAKRQAILRGAARVFARDGYSRASIDSIAGEAEVSTRTIYNHFSDKEHLFCTVIGDSAREVAETEIGLIDAYLRDGADPESELTEFARAWLAPAPAQEDHIALVRQIGVDAGHVPAAAVDAWREAGPLLVRRALSEKFSGWSRAGVLQCGDAVHAAVHFAQLISAARPGPTSGAAAPDETDAWILSGVGAFLHGYGRR